MLTAGQEWRSPDGRSAVRVIEVSSERAVFELVLHPGSGKAAPHLHRDFTQRFEALEGEIKIRVGTVSPRALAVGESVEVPRGVGHADPWHESAAPAVARNIISPVTPFVHVIFATLGELLAAGKLNSQDRLTLPQMADVLHAGRAASWGKQPPIAVQRLIIPLIAAWGRARGIRPVAS